MSKLTKLLFAVWMLLAIAAFIGAFWISFPVVRVISIVFGILNLTIIMSWISALIHARKGNKEEKV